MKKNFLIEIKGTIDEDFPLTEEGCLDGFFHTIKHAAEYYCKNAIYNCEASVKLAAFHPEEEGDQELINFQRGMYYLIECLICASWDSKTIMKLIKYARFDREKMLELCKDGGYPTEKLITRFLNKEMPA